MIFSAANAPFMLAGGVCAAALLALLRLWRDRADISHIEHDENNHASISFLFDGDDLVDASPDARALLGDEVTLQSVVDCLGPRFRGLDDAVRGDGQDLIINPVSADDAASLRILRRGHRIRIEMRDPEGSIVDRHRWLIARGDNQRHATALAKSPVIVWTTRPDGERTFANDAYRALAEENGGTCPFSAYPSGTGDHKTRRHWIASGDDAGGQNWYDVTSRDLGNGERAHYAINADAIVTAEVAQRNFVQTLTKTFAQLSIGLAIFDRKRQLALFNPALIDLTALPADFLSGRPSVNAFFDQLRERQIMPEPRNYRSWRDQLADMLSAAQDGAYCETWTLPSSLTYRISGKPHPDGAVAFLIEDISAEISLTRRFRAELEQSQSVLDTLDEPIAVFSRNGVLTFCNETFRRFWKCNPDESFIELSVTDASRIWQTSCKPAPIWGDLRDFVTSVDERSEWFDDVEHVEHGPLRVHAAPLVGGSTMIRFIPATTGQANRVEDSSVPAA